MVSSHPLIRIGMPVLASLLLATRGIAQTDVGLDGVWRSVGYGLAVQIHGDSLASYELTAVSS